MNRTNGTDQDRIGDIYDEFAEEELARLDQTSMHRAEFALTMALIRDHLATPSRVLDVGSGPGRYAEALLAEVASTGVVYGGSGFEGASL